MALAGPDGLLALRVTPNARANAIHIDPDRGRLLVSTTVTPEGGKANAAVIELVAGALGLPQRQVRLTSGATSRDKRVRIG